jgi:hypothetical protein
VTSDSGPSQISVVLDTTATEVVTREWSIKIFQYECSSPNLAPSGCLQYFTAASGQFQSFNYKPDIREIQGDGPSHLANLNYAVCFRIENGFCGIKYGQVTSDTFSFTISGDSRSVHLNCLNRVCSSRDTVECLNPKLYLFMGFTFLMDANNSKDFYNYIMGMKQTLVSH